jgi:HD-like signal output (HDOD) protein
MPQTDQAPTIRIDKDFDMPGVPVVLIKILQVIDNDHATAGKLEELILHDPSLSARILRLANSAFYPFRREIRTISHAIALLGLDMVRSLAIAVSIFESFTSRVRKAGRHIHQLWVHSFGVGLLAKEVWRPRSTASEAEFAFICGLLHDIGMVVFFRQAPATYSQIFAQEKGDAGPDISTLEAETYHVTHATLGSVLATRWLLPADLALTIGRHHDPFACDLPIVGAVSLADILAKEAGIGYDGDSKGNLDLDALLGRLGMDEEEYTRLSSQAKSGLNEITDFFSPSRR